LNQIDPAGRVAALIRSQVASLRRTAGARDASTPAPIPRKGAGRQSLAGVIAQRLQSIDAQDPQRDRRVFRIFLESVLLAELGDDLINDPVFATMVDGIQQQMEGDPELAPMIHQAARLLGDPPDS
jgi:hypothetical protein